MSDEIQTQDDFLGDIAAAATGTVDLPEDVAPGDAVPNAVADQVEEYDQHAQERDAHLVEDADQGDDHQGQDGQRRQVPLGALQKERANRQQAQAQVTALQQQLAALQQAQQQAVQQQQAAQREAEIPAFVDDPEGHLNALRERFEAELADIRGGQQAQQQAAEVQREMVDAAQYATQAEAEFRKVEPNFDAAFAHVQADAKAQLQRMYPSATPEQIQQVEVAALVDFAASCRKQGVNPCELIMHRAQQLGFQSSRRAPNRPAPTSLSNIGGEGRAPDQRGNVSAKDIANMSNEQFDAFFDQMRKADEPRFFN